MGFDQDEPGPLVNVHKRTTKVNLWMAVAIVLFLAAGGGLIWWFARR